MGLLTPLALVFAGLSVPIIVLYMLKLRRRDVLVSSTLLWRRLVRDREANAPWQRPRPSLLLLLQLLLLALLTLALARPYLVTKAVVSGNVVVLLDSSASMQASDVSPTRFDAGVRAAQEIVAGLGGNDAATLIAVGPQPLVLTPATSDRTLLRRALDRAAPTNGVADWEAAFALATAGLAGAQDAQVVIISDGALPEMLPSLPGAVRFVKVGSGDDNLAIAALATREGPQGPQLFLRVTNHGGADAESLVEFSADGALFDARRLFVPAHSSVDLTITDLPYDLSVLRAHLTGGDALPLDNTAWTVHAPPASGRVLLVSDGNIFLQRALEILPSVELVRLAPDQPLPVEFFDLYVYDRPVTSTFPIGNLWLIGPTLPVYGSLPVAVREIFTDTAITDVAADDPLLRYVDLSSVHSLEAREVEPPPGARILAEAEGGPLLFVVERPEGRLAMLTFDLGDSDLPLQIAFPILTANLIDWLLPAGATSFRATIRPGNPVPIPADPEAARILITAPDGTQSTLPVGATSPVFAATDRLGVYLIEQVDRSGNGLESGVFAVNLFDEAESNIAPREVVRVGQTEVTTALREEEGRRELWPWLAGIALCVFGMEWWVYQRGTLQLNAGRGRA